MEVNTYTIQPAANLKNANLVDADLRDAYLGDADLTGANLRDADLTGANLRDADLRDAYLGGADLTSADLGGADLTGANLRGADLVGAYLRGANLASKTIIDGGEDQRGFRFVGVQHEDGIMIAAGCRWFSLPEALNWWSQEGKSAECLRKVQMIEAEARDRGWVI